MEPNDAGMASMRPDNRMDLLPSRSAMERPSKKVARKETALRSSLITTVLLAGLGVATLAAPASATPIGPGSDIAAPTALVTTVQMDRMERHDMRRHMRHRMERRMMRRHMRHRMMHRM